MVTGFSAVRSGIVMFVIPFVFALLPGTAGDPGGAARIRRAAADTWPAMTGTLHWGALGWLLLRLALALYLLASALARFDRGPVGILELVLRLGLVVLVLHKAPEVHLTGLVAGRHW